MISVDADRAGSAQALQRLARAENLLKLASAECNFNRFVRTFATLTEA